MSGPTGSLQLSPHYLSVSGALDFLYALENNCIKVLVYF